MVRGNIDGAYTFNAFKRFLANKAIQHMMTVPRNLHLIRVAERMNGTIGALVRCMMHHKKAAAHFAKAVAVSVYGRHMVTTGELGSRTIHVATRDWRRKAWRPVSGAMVLGYTSGSQGFKLFDMNEKKVVMSRGVRFNMLEVIEYALTECDDKEYNLELVNGHTTENEL